MELGRARLRKVGINNLHCAVHPQHGVIWTDGRGIYLAPLHVDGKQVQNATSVRLGQFENVTSVHWSCLTTSGDEACFLCVVHQHNVTVWRVSGVLPKLTFKQIRKINVRPIAQGCLWNPINETLALLSRHQCSFYFQHDSNKGSYALPPLESGKIACGCWSSDGKKLIVCIGAALLIYRWSETTSSVSDFVVTAWRVPSLEGEITSISPMPKNCLVVATEMPLESLCRKQDAFNVQEDDNDQHDDIIRPGNRQSAKDRLMNLQPNAQMKENSSNLTLIKFHEEAKEPTKISSAPLKGVLTPDILLYEKSSQCVVVGSNSQSQLHIYALLDKHLAYCGDIQLEKVQRPKGLCSMPTYFDERGAALLILVGQRDAEEETFLSPSVEADFQVSLKYIIIKPGYEGKSRQKGAKGEYLKSRSMANLRGTNLGKSESMREQLFGSLSTGLHTKGRSGSTRDIARGPSPLLTGGGTGAGRGTSPLVLTTSGRHSTLPRDSKLGRPTSPLSDGISLDILSSSPARRTNGVQDISPGLKGSSPYAEDLEVERATFASNSPQFANHELSRRFDLGSRDKPNGMGSSSDIQMRNSPTRGILRNSPAPSLLRHSPTLSDADARPRPALAKSLSDHTDDGRSQRLQQRSAFTKSYTEESVHSGRESPASFLKKAAAPSSPRSPPSSPMARSESPNPLAKFRPSHIQDESDSQLLTRSRSPARLHSPLTLDWQRNGRTEAQDENQASSHREEVTSDLGSSRHSNDSSFDSMEKQVKSQKNNIEHLQRRLEDLSTTVEESCCVFPTKYQTMAAPELLEIHCIKSGVVESKKFLLDDGRLQLEPVRLAFDLATVELWLDGVGVVLTSNIDGYVPMKFSPSSVLRITGLPQPLPKDYV